MSHGQPAATSRQAQGIHRIIDADRIGWQRHGDPTDLPPSAGVYTMVMPSFAPRCLGSAAMVAIVSAAVRNRIQPRQGWIAEYRIRGDYYETG